MDQEQFLDLSKKLVEVPDYELRKNMLSEGLVKMLGALGLDMNSEHLRDTPERVSKAWLNELFCGYFMDEKQVLSTSFEEQQYDQMIFVDGIDVHSHCSHHLVPFTGEAKIGYLPNKRVIGLSKLARITDMFARRLQVQERLTQEVAEALFSALEPVGCGIYIKAKHMCACARGVRNHDMAMVTVALKGSFLTNPSIKEEFLELCRK